jgi:DNA replication protein DnaC
VTVKTIDPPAPPELPADLAAGLRRLKLATMRRLAPELLITAKAQRWKPEDLLRTLVDAEIASRDASNAATRLRTAGFPVTKTLDELDRGTFTHTGASLDYLESLDWLRTRDNVCLVGPPGTGKSHLLIALGHAAVTAGHRVRYFTAAELVDTLLRADYVIVDELGFAPLDDTGSQLLFRFVAAAYEHRSLGTASHWPFDQWGRFLPEHTTATALLDRLLHHGHVLVTEGDSYRMLEARTRTTRTRHRAG